MRNRLTDLRIISVSIVLSCSAAGSAAEPSPAQVFDSRILPIFRSDSPSSCVQCHLSSVDLKD